MLFNCDVYCIFWMCLVLMVFLCLCQWCSGLRWYVSPHNVLYLASWSTVGLNWSWLIQASWLTSWYQGRGHCVAVKSCMFKLFGVGRMLYLHKIALKMPSIAHGIFSPYWTGRYFVSVSCAGWLDFADIVCNSVWLLLPKGMIMFWILLILFAIVFD